jgi:hypothetical protein
MGRPPGELQVGEMGKTISARAEFVKEAERGDLKYGVLLKIPVFPQK